MTLGFLKRSMPLLIQNLQLKLQPSVILDLVSGFHQVIVSGDHGQSDQLPPPFTLQASGMSVSSPMSQPVSSTPAYSYSQTVASTAAPSTNSAGPQKRRFREEKVQEDKLPDNLLGYQVTIVSCCDYVLDNLLGYLLITGLVTDQSIG